MFSRAPRCRRGNTRDDTKARAQAHGMAFAHRGGMHSKLIPLERFSVSHSWLAAVAAAALGVTGCGGGDVDGNNGAGPAEAQQRIQATVPGMSAALTQSMDRWSANETLSSLSQSLSTVEVSFERLFPSLVSEEDDALPPPVAGLLAARGGIGLLRGCTGAYLECDIPFEDPEPGVRAAEEETGEEVDIGAEIEALAELIFTEENHEGDGIYRIRGATFCEIDGVVDAECAAQIDDLELRVRATMAGDGMDVGFRIGPDQDEPFVLELRSNSLAFVVDLADLKDVAEFLNTDGSGELPRVMEGVVAFSLLVPSETEAEVRVSVREAIRFETDSSGTGPAMKLETEARDPLFSLAASEQALKLALDVGRTRITGPWSAIQSDGLDVGELDIDWQGLSYTIDLAAGADALAVRNIGLGDGTSTIKLDGATVLSVDLNKDSGRRFDIDLSLDDAGLPLLAVSPGIDLDVSYDLQALADGGVAVDAPVLAGSYSISVGGEQPAVQPVDADFVTGFPGGVRVISGELAVSVDSASLVVPAGKCLIETVPAPEAHPILGALSVVDCP
jgi:hypothetical protein